MKKIAVLIDLAMVAKFGVQAQRDRDRTTEKWNILSFEL